MAESQADKAQAQQFDPQVLAQALILALAQQGIGQNKTTGFKGTTEGQLTIGMVILGVVLMGISALAPVNPEVSTKLMSMAEQLWTYVPIAYALSRGLAKGGLPLPGLTSKANTTGGA